MTFASALNPTMKRNSPDSDTVTYQNQVQSPSKRHQSNRTLQLLRPLAPKPANHTTERLLTPKQNEQLVPSLQIDGSRLVLWQKLKSSTDKF